MNTDLNALVNAIRAAPDDDLPRLVYADWLEEHDKPTLAELTRLQCGVVDLRDRRRGAFREVQDVMVRRNALHSSPEFYVERGAPWASWGYFYRGLIPTISFPMSSWVPEDLEQLGHTYGVDYLTMTQLDVPDRLGDFMRWRVLDVIPSVELRVSDPTGQLTGPMLQVVARRQWTKQQKTLHLNGLNFVDDLAREGLELLAQVADQTILNRIKFGFHPRQQSAALFARFRDIVGPEVAERSIQ